MERDDVLLGPLFTDGKTVNKKNAGDVASGSSPWPTWNLAITALLVSLGGGFNFGYQLLITNPAQEAFIQFVNISYTETHGVQQNREALEFIWGVIVSTFFWGATVGSLLIQTVADSFGRKRGLVLTFFVQIISVLVAIASYFTTSYIIYSISRITLGIAISVSLGIGPMFIIECSPVACRGMISMATGVMLQLGLVAGAISAMPETWGTVESWWLVYALELVLTVFITVLVAFVPDSPIYLVTQSETRKAVKSLVYYHCITEAEAKLLLTDAQQASKGDESVGLFGIFKDRMWLCGSLVSAVVMGGTMLSGIAAVNAFAFEILLSVGLNGLQASIANIVICFMAAVGALLSSQLVERLGRRPLLLSTFAAIAIVNAVLSGLMYLFALTTETWIGWCVVVAICIFNLVFATGPGPVCFLVPGELVGQRARAATYTWVNIIMNGIRSVLLAFYLPLRALLGGPLCYFLLFFPPCVITVAICYYWLPETSGRTPEQARSDMNDLPRICGTIKKSDVNKELQLLSAP
ncbi:hypothetical protein KIN20_035030 [Parelaphostrongylus tenuis]|uniref:Major facilitator superfamily (MFS) profile domain-containing protein n=2 Tax=Parelaphostrongylus tenuis TaxID=148309 RepID=A0AAD5RB33_PARTN|nr:hypothetical protein KIN20_035030 [Parelaphostrongylus tenuis]